MEESVSERRCRLERWKSLAFNEREEKRRAAALDVQVFADARGEEMLALASGRPSVGENSVVFMAWEKPYMVRLVALLELTHNDRVLEIGYGLGFSARAICDRRPTAHDVLEIAPAVVERSQTTQPTNIIVDSWQHYLKSTKNKYDAVFFDDFPLDDGEKKAGLHSRWIDFLMALRPALQDQARITGYLAHDDALQHLPEGYRLETLGEFQLPEKNHHRVPPDDCLYHGPDDRCLLPLLRYHKTTTS